MAVPHQAQLRDNTYLNWVKAGLGLKYTKEGIESFIDNEAKVFHSSLLNHIGQQPQNCGQCTADNLLPHPSSACPVWRMNCICSRGPSYQRQFCPNNICGTLFNAIVSEHRFKGPSWKNSHISQWVTDHWEVAKNFLPNTGGYANVKSATDTDLSGLVNIGINLDNITRRHNLTVSNVNGPDDFIKCRTTRNKILHCASQSLTDAELRDYLNVMKATLQCTEALKEDTAAQEAVTKLTQLETSAFQITDENITEVKEAALLAIQEEGSRHVEAIKEEGEKQNKFVVSSGIQAEKRALYNVDLESERQRKMIKSEAEEAVDDIHSKGTQQIEAMDIEGEKQIQKIQQTATTQADARYQEEKKKLKHHLIETYIAQLQPTTLPEVDRLYVEPRIEKVTGDTEGKAVKIEEVFFHSQTQFNRIYISGDAGHGKTALCKMLVLAWCQEHTGEEINKYIPDDFLTVMKKFEFLFYITLRNTVKDWVVSEIIKKQYFEDQNFLSMFIKNESVKNSCLVILDGLDEWEPPADYETPMHSTHGLPDLRHFKKYTVLITTRPWKLEVLRLGPLEMDRQVQLKGIDKRASDKYIKNLVQLLNQKKNLLKQSPDFQQELKNKQLTHLQNIPILLKHFLTLWHHDEKEITGSSQVHLYSAMINHLLKDAWERNKKKSLAGGNIEGSELPSCLKKKQYCKIHKDLLLSLALLAFTSLFQGHLVFDHVEAELQNLTEDDIKSCLIAGVLCQEIYASPLNDEKKKLSFLHKSFQDFLAAVFLVMNPESVHLPQTCNTMQKILDMRSLFIFVSGMDSKVMVLLLHQIQIILENDEEVKQYNRQLDFDKFKPMQDLMCAFVQESKESGQLLTQYHLEHVIISNFRWRDTNWSSLQHLISNNMSNIKYMYIGDVRGDPPEGLLTCLSLVLECRSVQHVSIRLVERLPRDMEALLDKALCNNWSLSSMKLMMSGCDPYSKYLYQGRVTTLVKLSICRVSVRSHTEYERVMEGVGRATQLKTLELRGIECRECSFIEESSHHLYLSHYSQLQELTLEDCHVNKVTVNTSSLTYCMVSDTPVYFVPLPHVVTMIRTLELRNISDSHSLDDIVAILPHLTELSHLTLCSLDLGDRDVCLSPEATHLECLQLSSVNITDWALIQFLDSVLATNRKVDCEISGDVNKLVETHIASRFVMTRTGTVWLSNRILCFHSQSGAP